MFFKIHGFTMSLFFAVSVYAQGGVPSPANPNGNPESVSIGTANPEKANEIFFQPMLTLFSLLTDKLPVILSLTYEHHLQDGNSFVWQQQVQFGNAKIDDSTKTSEFSLLAYLGLRKYFHSGLHRGFYVQGSGAGSFGSFDAERIGNPDKASGIATSFGALGYLGYKWTHVFFDAGAGYQHASGTLKFNDGRELDVSASGAALDVDLGIGF